MDDGNWIYFGYHFPIYTNVESLCCTPEANIMFLVNYTSIKIFLIQKNFLIWVGHLFPISSLSTTVHIQLGNMEVISKSSFNVAIGQIFIVTD